MRIKDIKESIDYFKSAISKPEYESPLYLYELPQKIDRGEYRDWVGKACKSNYTQRLWKRSNYQPLMHLLEISAQEEEYFNHACFDLLNEENSLEGRVSRFIFYMDELLSIYRKRFSNTAISDHHIDQAFVSILLSKAYPEKYGFYRFELFKLTAQRIGAQPTPIADELERFQKFINVYITFIKRDQELVGLFDERCRFYHLNFDHIPANFAVECMLMREQFDIIKD